MNRTLVSSLALIAGVYGWAVSLISIFRTGLGWDSVFDLNAAKISLENSYPSNLNYYYETVPITSEFYGTLVYKISNFLSLVLTNKSIFEDTSIISNYYFIDFTTWAISLMSVIITCLSLYLAFNSPNISILYFGIISSLPIWVGMSQVNSKDIPVAAGLTILSSGLMLILKRESSKKLLFIGVLFTSLGSGISLSVRPASAPIILMFLFLNTLILFFANRKNQSVRQLVERIFYTCSITIVFSIVFLYLSNPISFKNLHIWIMDATRVSLNYPSVQPIKVFGKDFLSNDLPSWYVLAWVWAQLPTLTFVSLILGFIFILQNTFVNRKFELAYSVTPFLIQSLAVPFAFLLAQPNLYNGIRHILFIYPSLMLIPVLFLDYILVNYPKKALQIITCTFASMVLILNSYATYRWLPYSYAFINPVAGLGEKRNWDLDYWGLSSREGIEILKDLEPTSVVVVMPDNSSSIPFGGKNLAQLNSSERPFNLYVFIHWNHKIVEEHCKIDFEIKRDNQTLGMGGRCLQTFE
jgi:hypothetical protein